MHGFLSFVELSGISLPLRKSFGRVSLQHLWCSVLPFTSPCGLWTDRRTHNSMFGVTVALLAELTGWFLTLKNLLSPSREKGSQVKKLGCAFKGTADLKKLFGYWLVLREVNVIFWRRCQISKKAGHACMKLLQIYKYYTLSWSYFWYWKLCIDWVFVRSYFARFLEYPMQHKLRLCKLQSYSKLWMWWPGTE